MQILVVDDDPLACEMTAALLEFQGYTTIMANDAIEAVQHLDNLDTIELIVSDMHMPLINGIEFLEMLREQDVSLPFILLSGDTPEPELLQTPGLNACLQKDAQLTSTLQHAVTQALNG